MLGRCGVSTLVRRSHLCLSCRKESYQKKNKTIHDTNMMSIVDIELEGLDNVEC
jgi:hypothetical protein